MSINFKFRHKGNKKKTIIKPTNQQTLNSK
jgi:hypothetical protein